MSDYPGHPNDGNYDCPRYQRAVVIYFFTLLAVALSIFVLYIKTNT